MALLGALLAAHAARGQAAARAFELEAPELSPGGRGGALVNGASLLPHGKMNLSLFAAYDYEPVVYRLDDLTYAAPIDQRLSAHLIFAVVPLRRLQLGVQLPLILAQGTRDLSGYGIATPGSFGVGAANLNLRYGVAFEDDGDPFDVATDVIVRLPSLAVTAPGHPQPLGLSARVAVARTAGALRLEGAVSGLVEPTTLRDAGAARAVWVGVNLAAVHSRNGFGREVDVAAHWPIRGGPPSFEVLAGARYAITERFEAFLLAGPGVGAAPTFSFRFLAGVTFGEPVSSARRPPLPSGPGLAPAPERTHPAVVLRLPAEALDSDRDGLPDSKDACPLEAGPVALKGCPDRDSDGDGLLDSVDECPTIRGVVSRHGCPVPDRDRDGIADEDDACPDEAGPMERVGCPMKDSDEDGIIDEVDRCPNEKGPVENQGCLLRDRDNDGVPDDADACPDEAGPAEQRGCPARDRDGDGVLDAVDNCPGDKGPAGNQGCPKKLTQYVIITKQKLVITQKVYFETARSRILPRSFTLLDQVARVLREHPEIEHLVIEGHTDNRGNRELNVALSQARADAVRSYLVEQGVTGSRLTSRGFGPERPAFSNLTAGGREANRRVEFMIE